MGKCKKTQRKVVLILVLSLLIPLINYYKQSVKADSTTTTTSSTIGEISATDEVELVEDFTNSPVLKYVNADGTKTMYMMFQQMHWIYIGDTTQKFKYSDFIFVED